MTTDRLAELSIWRLAIAALLAALLLAMSLPAAAQTVVWTIGVGTQPRYVAVNPTTNRVYVSNSGSDDVSVIDAAANTVVATVVVGANPQDLAVNPATNRFYVVTTGSEGVLLVDTDSNIVVATLPAGSHSAQVAVDETTNRFYVTNTMIGNVSVFDGASNALITAVELGERPTGSFGVAVHSANKEVWLPTFSPGSNHLVLFDAVSNTISSRLADVGGGTGVAVNPTTGLVYVVDPTSNVVAVVDGATRSAAGQPGSLPKTSGPFLPLAPAVVVALALVGLGLTIRLSFQAGNRTDQPTGE